MINKKLIIEVRANEYTLRRLNSHIPYSPEELGMDAREVEAAGASIYHFHARSPDGAPEYAYAAYRDAVVAIRRASNLLLHPTLGGSTLSGDEARIAHIERLCSENLKPEFAPVDLGSANLDFYDKDERRFTTEEKSYVNSVKTLKFLLGRLNNLGVRPVVTCWNIPFVRSIDHFYDAGYLRGPIYVKLFHTGDGQSGGHQSTPGGLQAFLDAMPILPIEWTCCTYRGDHMAVARKAIALGGHIAIGVGDYHYAEWGCPTNAALVERIVSMAKDAGREVASPDETRSMLGIT